MKRQDLRFFHRLRVRWAEVDMQKIVFNGHYLMYLDTAMADYWRTLALPYEEAMHQLGGDLYVKKASVEYHGSARYDDALDVGLRCTRIGSSSIQFIGAIFRGEDLLITAELIYVYADPSTQTSRPVPDALRQVMLGYEDGEPVLELRTGGWEQLHEDAMKVRIEVFVEEQRIPLAMEQDPADEVSLHAVAYNRLGMPVATGRLLPAEAGTGRIGRMAVKRVLREAGIGSQVLQALVAASSRRGDVAVALHAQRSAEGFYARSGFSAQGDGFEEVGLPHIEMTRAV
ncbi:MAG: YbgC/FadM family acyl-CoA thioesterase [Betaproteobacteria bacterium]